MNTLILPPLRRKHSKIVSWFAGTAAALAVTLSMSPVVNAQTVPNGQYEYISTTGSITIAGKTIPINSDLPFVTTPEGTIKIEGNKLYFSTQKSTSVIKLALTKLNLLSNIKISATGPNYITMSQKDNSYVGVIASPITINFSGVSGPTTARGRVKFSPRAKVKAGNLAITIPVGGVYVKSGISKPISGSVTIQAKLIP